MKKPESKGSVSVVISSPHQEGGGYEGSFHDWKDDYAASRRKGISREDYEDSASDRLADKAGAKRVRDEGKTEINNSPNYKSGVSASRSQPKQSHGYGHAPSCRQGQLRCSGTAGAHQLGRKK